MEVELGSQDFRHATEAAAFLQSRLPEIVRTPQIGVICGSGLGQLSQIVESISKVQIPYRDIPNFPQTSGSQPQSFPTNACI